MSTVKRIVCLANARKERERCIAGKELLTDDSAGTWLRPVSDQRPSGALSRSERIYLTQTEPALLDIVECRVEAPRPETYQQENWALAGDNQFKKTGSLAWDDLGRFVDCPSELWINGDGIAQEFGGSARNRIPIDQTGTLASSLLLVKVDFMQVDVGKGKHGQPTMDGRFQHGPLGYNYRFSITDPAFEEKYSSKAGRFSIGESYLTISLAGQSDGYAYKLIAGIMERE